MYYYPLRFFTLLPTKGVNMGSRGSLQTAGKSRDQVNVISWSKTEEIAQLSNFGAASLTLEFTAEDLAALGMNTVQVTSLCSDGLFVVHCGSVEGFVQGLKARELQQQRQISQESGKAAKTAGAKVVAEIDSGIRRCYFAEFRFDYCSPEHRALIEYAIWCKFAQCEKSKQAMLWTGEARITHNMGRYDAKPGKTSLPKQVFTRILSDCREMVQGVRAMKTFREILDETRTDVLNEAQWYQPTP